MNEVFNVLIPLRGLAPFFLKIFVLFMVTLVASHFIAIKIGSGNQSALELSKKFNAIRIISKFGAIISLLALFIFGLPYLLFST
ncbi:MAG: hypothetical protein CMK56_01485 [Proteobacteria bacterium]|nr:hypothetical protein [Pseudomonadota bacterium]